MMQLYGMILDVDGTLIASNAAHARAWVDALAEYGYAVAYEQVYRRIGMGGDKLLPSLIGVEEDTATGEAIGQRRRQIFMERYFPAVRPTPGARALLERLRAAGLRLVVATSAQADELEALVERAGVRDLVPEATTSSDAPSSKPSPDIVVAALEKLGCAPEAAVMLGDTPYDIEAAGRAGIATIALRSGGWDDAGLAGAVAIYDDPADLLAHLDESPLAGRSRSAGG